jgi:putative flippase GtrA
VKARDGSGDGTRFVVFAIGGGFIAAIGFVLLYGFVDLGMDPAVAYGVQLLLTFAANYVFTRYVTFRDRRTPLTSTQVWRFAYTRGAALLGGWLLFLAQVKGLGLRYVVANAICLVVTSAVNYATSESYVFTEVPAR